MVEEVMLKILLRDGLITQEEYQKTLELLLKEQYKRAS